MAEAAGIVLAVIPICVTVVEKYTQIAKLVQKIRKYEKYAGYVSQAMNIHSAIYKNAIRILLSSIVSEDEARVMISDPEHSLWRDPQLDREICDRLNDSRDAFIDAGSAIQDKLAEFRRIRSRLPWSSIKGQGMSKHTLNVKGRLMDLGGICNKGASWKEHSRQNQACFFGSKD